MSKVSAIIVEDEIPVAKSLKTLLDLNNEVIVAGMAHNLNDAKKNNFVKTTRFSFL